jgi:DNA polymerase III delta subunit
LFLFHREASGAEGAHPVLAMCAWQARRLLLVREMRDKGMRHAQDIAAETKLPPFAVEKMLGTIDHFPLARIKKGLSLLSDFDTELKQGGRDPLVALDLFIWKF